MKTLGFAALLTLLAPALGYADAMTCSRGEPDQKDRVAITLAEDGGVKFDFYETSIDIPAAQVVRNGDAVAVLEQRVTSFSEGDKYSALVDALLVYNAKKHALNVTMIWDGRVHLSSATIPCN